MARSKKTVPDTWASADGLEMSVIALNSEEVSAQDVGDPTASYAHRATTRLFNGGRYEMPVIMVSSRTVQIYRGPGVEKVQLRSVERTYVLEGGRKRIVPGQYKVSLYGSTYGRQYIFAHVDYS